MADDRSSHSWLCARRCLPLPMPRALLNLAQGQPEGERMTAIAESDTATLDKPTVTAAVVTLTFAVLAGVALGALPQEGTFGGALDAIKNVVYVLTVPLFDLSRRLFARRKARAVEATPPADTPNLLGTAFVTALVLFILIELLSWLTGFGMGSVCALFGQQGQITDFGQCLTLGVNVFGLVLVGPIMIALGATAGWLWKGILHKGLLTTLLIFMVVVAALFSLDFFILLQQNAGPAQALQDHFNSVGPVRQIGLQVVILTLGILLGYGARRLWQGVARVFT
ncbi:hypothetical protein [Hyphomicrobium sp.]|uniref:hypothetical protein n=1 Tax=Hyphomicrobium sp. TaxID=82 RepID=UPI0025C6A046|nr:hypothetical protein [Hyphomicrobium sp.]MCC7252473.1 hypothetical protein [Hyphomicrobium sp.]